MQEYLRGQGDKAQSAKGAASDLGKSEMAARESPQNIANDGNRDQASSGGGGSGSGSGKIPEKEVTIKYKNFGKDPDEFKRQLKGQEDGINDLSAGEIKANIDNFKKMDVLKLQMMRLDKLIKIILMKKVMLHYIILMESLEADLILLKILVKRM